MRRLAAGGCRPAGEQLGRAKPFQQSSTSVAFRSRQLFLAVRKGPPMNQRLVGSISGNALLRVLAVLTALCSASGGAGAQVVDLGLLREPGFTVSLQSGVLYLQGVDDGPSTSYWDFNAIQLHRVSLERRIGYNTSLGVSFGFAELPMNYVRTTVEPPFDRPCIVSCRATAQFSHFGALLRFTSGTRLVQSAELTAGVSQYSRFRDVGSGAKLAPLKHDHDASLTAGYGLAWSFGFLQVGAVADVGFSMHSRAGIDADQSELNYLASVRLVVRQGFGR
jgi:hypothetical protein